MNITVLRGMAGSGKSTWARTQTDALIVSRDDIRNNLRGTTDKKWRFDQKLEDIVTRIEEAAVRAALDAGLDVIVDAMHLRKRYAEKWLYFYPGANVGFKFFDVSLEDAIERRGGDIPLSVLKAQHKRAQSAKTHRLVRPDATPVVQDTSLPCAVIFDIDGTLALMGERNPYDLSRVFEDAVNQPIAYLKSLIEDAETHHIIVVSGRSEEAREATEDWFDWHFGSVPELHMRGAGDNRPDYIIKREILEAHILPRYQVDMVFDDRNSVVAMWRDAGLTCLQVAEGNF